MPDHRFPRLPAVLRNAITWGAAWAAGGGALVTALSLLQPRPETAPFLARLGMAVATGIGWGVRFGVAGTVIGTVFALAVRHGYRGRRLADLRLLPFTLLGAVVGGVGVPLFLQTMNVLSGDGPVAWRLVTDDAVWATVFGAAVAAGCLLIARRTPRARPAPAAPLAIDAGVGPVDRIGPGMPGAGRYGSAARASAAANASTSVQSPS